jgi:WD40 repeat protein
VVCADLSRWQVAFSPSGHLLAVSGADGVIRVFDTVRYKQLRTLDAHVNWVWAAF